LVDSRHKTPAACSAKVKLSSSNSSSSSPAAAYCTLIDLLRESPD
jgi:hypothetical protein